jgi:succinyl-CoA synthetase beta subunit
VSWSANGIAAEDTPAAAASAAWVVSTVVDLYEHQGKELFSRFGIPVSEGRVAATPEEARAAAGELGGKVVVKAQVLTGGRGKAGGVKLATDPDEAARLAGDILGLDIRGHVVRRLWVEKASDIAREYYLSVTLDRGAGRTLLMFTTEGGVEIEQIAAESPEALVRVHVDPLEGLEPHHVRELSAGVEDESQRGQIEQIVEALYRCYVESDATLCEVNPLIVTPDGIVRALDAKVTIDDSALPRHPDLAELQDTWAADPLEAYAHERGVIYVKLDGSVGILGNGAGLSMATVDVVVVAGGKPANFCDLGGGGSAEGVVAALEVIARDPDVRSILFNIFGGITRCDEVARGILAALEQIDLRVPIVVRLDGTNAAEGRQILSDAGNPSVHVSPTMLEAAQLAVELAA